jgi:hypothetical protein
MTDGPGCRSPRRAMWLGGPVFLLSLILGPLTAEVVAAEADPAASTVAVASANTEELQRLVDDLRARLNLPAEVTVSLVAQNPLIVSVQANGADAFQMSFEETFLRELSEDDLAAVIAHELGHVWIFTHHPFLQTEQLANRIAMRVVTRESLERVYVKVWERKGTKGTVERFLGN